MSNIRYETSCWLLEREMQFGNETSLWVSCAQRDHEFQRGMGGRKTRDRSYFRRSPPATPARLLLRPTYPVGTEAFGSSEPICRLPAPIRTPPDRRRSARSILRS